MDFSFNETQVEVQNLANQILQDLSTTERLNDIDKQDERFDDKVWAALAEAGLLGTAFSEANGGMGLGLTELCLFIEEVGRTVAAAPVVPVVASAGLGIQNFGTEEQQQRLLPGVVTGEKFITAAMAEARSECPASPETVAEASGDGFKLTGTKIAVPFAHKAERIVVTAKNGDSVGLFLVDPNAAGVELTAQVSTTREPWSEVALNGAEVAAADVMMATGAEEAIKNIAEVTAAAYSAMQVGVCDAMLKTTATYTCERIQFDQPIGAFQAVQHRAADCFIDIQCLKLTAYQAVSLLDQGRDATNETMIAKIWAGDTGHRVSYASQHLHGGTGIDRDYHLWRFCLWARQIEAVMGTSTALLSVLGSKVAAGEAYAE